MPLHQQVRSTPRANFRRSWSAGAIVLLLLAAVTVGFQAVYVFMPVKGALRADGFDTDAHYRYFRWVVDHPNDNPLAFRDSYTWVHFPGFYQWNALVSRMVCRFGGDGCVDLGLRIAWFLQAILRLATLAILWATFRRLFASPRVAIAALALCATSPRVFFTTCVWNQDDYVFFFAVICMWVTVAALQEGLTTGRIVVAALAAALGFHFKSTIMVPAAVMLGIFLLLPTPRAALRRKAAAVAVVIAAIIVVNWPLFATTDGIERLTWSSASFYTKYTRNAQEFVRAYLTLDAGPILGPEPIYVRVSWLNVESRHSTATAIYLYLFELYENFQGPPRTWLNLLCAWTGTPLLALVVWRMARVAAGLRHPRTVALDELYCATLVVLSFAALFFFSLGVPFGWWPHPEYVLAAYPAAAVLLFRQLLAIQRPALFTSLAVLVVLHLGFNLAMLVYVAQYKISINV